MTRRLCGYRVKIKVNAFRLRARGSSVPAFNRPWQDKSLDKPGKDSQKAKKPVSPIAMEKAAELKALLHADLCHHYSIARFARKLGTNAKTLQEAFKQLTGKGIFEYGQEIRLEHGRTLLLETDLGIQEIAEACGYTEHTNFTVAFKKKFGEGPGMRRKG